MKEERKECNTHLLFDVKLNLLFIVVIQRSKTARTLRNALAMNFANIKATKNVKQKSTILSPLAD